jgi:AcrR family transcriptional regulator
VPDRISEVTMQRKGAGSRAHIVVPAVRAAGRPRDPRLDEQIMKAALSVLLEQGFRGMSFEMVSTRSGISKPTIYRRFRSKEELAVAVLPMLVASSKVKLSGDTLQDLAAEISEARSKLDKVGAALLGTLLSEEQRHPELIATYRQQAVKPRADKLRAILHHADGRAEISPHADLEAAVQLLMALITGSDVLGCPPDEARITAAVGIVLRGIACTPQQTASRAKTARHR